MSKKYKFTNNSKLYFVSFAVTNWIDLFVRDVYRNIRLGEVFAITIYRNIKVGNETLPAGRHGFTDKTLYLKMYAGENPANTQKANFY